MPEQVDKPFVIRHRMVFRFVHATQAAAVVEHFGFDGHDDMLALAIRATSSFPVAFAPVRPEDVKGTETFGPWFEDYKRAGVAHWQQWVFADGGFLDNKPFTYATAALRRRRADVPVDRALLYIEPDPALDPSTARTTSDRPNAAAVALDAIKLPRNEPIRDDIAALARRNAEIERLRTIIVAVGKAALRDTSSPSEAARVGYLRLRRIQLIDDLTEVLLFAAGRPAGGHVELYARTMLDVWLPHDGPSLQERLDALDIAYRLRRLVQLQDRVNDLLRGDGETLGLRCAPGPEEHAWLLCARKQLNAVAVQLRARGRHIRGRELGKPETSEHAAAFDAALTPFRPGADGHFGIADVLGARNQRAAAQAQLAARQPAFDELASALTAWLRDLFLDVDRAVEGALARGHGSEAADALKRYDACFEVIDSVSFPLGYPELGETNPVGIYRVSPRDVRGAVPGKPWHPSPPLAGAKYLHFGRFLNADWRRHDILRGRLDGSERLISSLVNDPARDRLLVQAHAAILREEIGGSPELADLVDSKRFAELCRAARPTDPVAAVQADTQIVSLFRDHYHGPTPLDSAKQHALERTGVEVALEVFEPIVEGVVHRAESWVWRHLKAAADKQTGRLRRALAGLFEHG